MCNYQMTWRNSIQEAIINHSDDGDYDVIRCGKSYGGDTVQSMFLAYGCLVLSFETKKDGVIPSDYLIPLHRVFSMEKK